MLAAVWTGPNLVARPFPGFRLHRKCYQTVYIFGLLFTALVTRCLRFWRFRKRREPLFHPCPDLAIVSLSFSRSHLLPFPFLFSFSTSIPCNEQLPSLVEGKGREGPLPLPTWHRNRGENALPWWWWWKRGGTRLERETFTLLPSFALTPIALDFHLEEAGCAEGSYEEITSGCTVTKRLFVFFFFLVFRA